MKETEKAFHVMPGQEKSLSPPPFSLGLADLTTKDAQKCSLLCAQEEES